jgi:hypothetical protein
MQSKSVIKTMKINQFESTVNKKLLNEEQEYIKSMLKKKVYDYELAFNQIRLEDERAEKEASFP